MSPEQFASKAVRVMSATAICHMLMAGRASAEREWKPRRHHRRLGERFSQTWAEDVVAEEDKEQEQLQAQVNRQQQLQREQVQVRAHGTAWKPCAPT